MGSVPPASRSRKRWLLWVGAVVVVAGGVSTGLVLSGGTPQVAPGTPSSPPASPTPPRASFAFPQVSTIRLSSGGGASAKKALAVGQEIGGTLSGFYDTAFADPANWGGPLPSSAWNAFSPSVRDRAEQDVETFSLGASGRALRSLSSTEGTLKVRVLFDPKGNPSTAIAEVSFQAQGELADGQSLEIDNEGSYLLRQVQGTWLIVGYPTVKTTVESVPSPAPSASSAPSGSPSP